MSFLELFQDDATDTLRRLAFLADPLTPPFQSAFDKTLENIRKYDHNPEPTQKFLQTGLTILISATKDICSLKYDGLLANDPLASQTTWQLGLSNGSLSTPAFDENSDLSAMDISSRRKSVIDDTFDDFGDLSLAAKPNKPSQPSTENDTSPSKLTSDTRSDPITTIGSVLSVYGHLFRQIIKIFEHDNIDLLPILFQENGETSILTVNDFHALLVHLNIVMSEIVASNEQQQFKFLDQIILLIYDIVATLTRLMSAERFNKKGDSIRAQALFKSFFLADFSCVFVNLLDVTTPLEKLADVDNSEGDNVNPNNDNSISIRGTKPLQIEYKTLLRILALLSEFACCPSSLLQADKDSFLMDIGSARDSKTNVYRKNQNSIDYSKNRERTILHSRLAPILCALFNHYYYLQPDLLLASLKHSSFFGWITGHAFAADLYMAVNTIEEYTALDERLDETKFPFIDSEDVSLLKLNAPESLKAIQKKVAELPSFLITSLAILNLLKNASFVQYFTGPHSVGRIHLLDIWLCVSSYVSQHQRISIHGRAAVRSSLLVLLELTCEKSPALSLLKSHKVNENVWKLCHQKAPFLPLNSSGPEVSALLYCIDVLQITLRFNVSKNFGLDNAKLALTVLYQILKECEARPYDDLVSYHWKEVYETLVHFMLFVSKHRNEEDVKYVIEEVFSIFELVLSPSFAKIIKKSPDYFLLGSHIIKSMNYDLFYILLLNYKPLLHLFEKYIIYEVNFSRIRKAFSTLEKEFKLKESREIDESEVVPILNKLSLLSDEAAEETVIDLKKFNYADTFKYWLVDLEVRSIEMEADFLDLYSQLFTKREK